MSSVKSPSRPTETAQKDSVADKLSDRTPRPAQTKQVRLKLVYIDFWSALKLSFLISVVLGIVLVVVVVVVMLAVCVVHRRRASIRQRSWLLTKGRVNLV